MSAASVKRSKGTFLSTRYHRIAAHAGANRANVATQHAILVAIWHMGRTGEVYTDLGADYHRRHNPDRTRRHAINQLETLGFRVTLEQAS
jgi:hypothetical protein